MHCDGIFYDINVLGDPALSVWTDEPISIQVNYQNTIPIGIPSTSVTITSGGSPMENFACTIIKDGILHGVGYTDASGIAQISFDPDFTTIGDAELTVSGYNCLPASYPVTIIPNSGSYVVYSSHSINDLQGNSNGEADYGETIDLTIEVENAGSVQANNVQVTLSTSDSYITITDGFENYGNIPGSSTMSITDGFTFDITSDIPDQHTVDFDLEITDGTDIWNSAFNITVNAPELEAGNNIFIDDVAGGNGNGRVDPGETTDITMQISNTGHSDSPDANAILSSLSTWITINSGSDALGLITPGSTVYATFNITCDISTPLGTSIDLTMDVSAGNYGISQTYYESVGIVLEDWETGGFSSFPWTFDGTADWFITDVDPYEGNYCSQSGTIADGQTSEMEVELYISTADNISFYRKVSSESSYDYLRFYIDGTQQGQWSGEVAWEQVSYPVTAGLHTFMWVYYKDGSVSNGSDCGWVDYIIFPPVSPPPEPPDIEVNPDSFEVTLPPNDQTTQTLTISNIGDADLEFSITKNYQNDKSPKAYCASVGGGGDEYISRVQIGNIDNSTAQTSYADYTSMSTIVVAGTSYPITITNGDPIWNTDQCGIWVDWNQNEDFYDDAPITVSSTPGVGPYTANIVPPVDAMPGPTRMRVQIIYSATPDPCQSFSYGEVEDYTLVVDNNFNDWLTFAPQTGTIPGSDMMNIDVTFNSTDMEEGDYYADLIISSNDPVEPQIMVPCTLHVGETSFDVDLTVFLEGPYNGGNMNTDLTSNPELVEGFPLSQPFTGAPWNYNGLESVGSIPNQNIVDWILVELRDATSAANATGATIISRQSGFLLSNGSIVSIDGNSPMFFEEDVSLGLFVVIYTRNHLTVLSASELTGGGGMYSYDFSIGSGQVYGGDLGYSNLGDGKWGMASGDGNCDGEVTLLDKSPEWEQQAGEAGYNLNDHNMDGQVDNTDKDEYLNPNIGKESQMPE